MTACPWEPFAAGVMMSKPCDSSHASWLGQFCIPILSTMTGEQLEGNSFLLHAHQPQCFSDSSDQVLCYSTCSDLHIACFGAYLIAANQNKNLFTSTLRFVPLFPFPAPWLYVGVSLLPKSGLCHLFLGLNCLTKPPVGGALWNTTSFHWCFWAGAVLLQTSREFRRNQRQCELHNKCACKQRQRHSPIAAAHGLCWSWEKGSQEVKEGRVESLLLDGDGRANWMWTENCANSLDSRPCLTQFFLSPLRSPKLLLTKLAWLCVPNSLFVYYWLFKCLFEAILGFYIPKHVKLWTITATCPFTLANQNVLFESITLKLPFLEKLFPCHFDHGCQFSPPRCT